MLNAKTIQFPQRQEHCVFGMDKLVLTDDGNLLEASLVNAEAPRDLVQTGLHLLYPVGRCGGNNCLDALPHLQSYILTAQQRDRIDVWTHWNLLVLSATYEEKIYQVFRRSVQMCDPPGAQDYLLLLKEKAV